jgi:asparagine synthetase B (glutamine-hydrolysing)
MSKSIYICSKETLPDITERRLYDICRKLAPANIIPAEPEVSVNGNIGYGIMNPTTTLIVKGNSLLMGQLFDDDGNWDKPLNQFPDGSYALFRDGIDYFEIVSDPVASRTIWYYMDDKQFIASTSQRAIVMFLGSFEFEDRVIPWMLSAGSLGPSFSWDKRIKIVPPDSSVLLDKRNWILNYNSNPIVFNPEQRSDLQHEEMLRESLKKTFKSLKLDYSRYSVLLSGGYDSRAVICLLLDINPDNHQLKTITWGLRSSLELKGNDARIAGDLAKKLNVTNKYYLNDISEDPIDEIINRFVLMGEGRTGDLSDYMDGFATWKEIFEDGTEVIIRGDEGFGCRPYSSALGVRMNQGCILCSDYKNLKDYLKYGLPSQELPQNLKQREGETLSAWRDRLFHEYTLPTEFSALSDLKLSYVEQINPLLSRTILLQVRQMPDHLRTGKVLFKKIVNSLSPEIDYATKPSSASQQKIMTQERFVNLLKIELNSDTAKSLFSEEFLGTVLNNLKSEGQRETMKIPSLSLRSFAGKIVPRFFKEALRNKLVLPSVDSNILAFRVLMIIKMNMILSEDSRNK